MYLKGYLSCAGSHMEPFLYQDVTKLQEKT